MKRGTNDEERLTRYLLGRMDPEEQALVEERYLADPAFHEELRATERDLIDRYVHGEIAEPDAFERHFLSSPTRRQRVEFARALSRSLARDPVVSQRTGSPTRGPVLPREGGSSGRVWQLLAASLVILVGGWLLIQGWRRPSPPQQAGPTPQGQPHRSQPQAPSSTPPRDGTPGPRPEPAPPVRVATFVLTTSLTRDRGETRTLVIEGNTEVRLQLDFEPGDYTSYRAVLRTGAREEIWRQGPLQPRRTATGQSVVVSLPASRFSSQDYTITLSGATRAGEFEDVSGYYFRVQRK
jgi:hypothetical protein